MGVRGGLQPVPSVDADQPRLSTRTDTRPLSRTERKASRNGAKCPGVAQRGASGCHGNAGGPWASTRAPGSGRGRRPPSSCRSPTRLQGSGHVTATGRVKHVTASAPLAEGTDTPVLPPTLQCGVPVRGCGAGPPERARGRGRTGLQFPGKAATRTKALVIPCGRPSGQDLPTEACRTYVCPGLSEYGFIVTVCPVIPTEKEGPQGHGHRWARRTAGRTNPSAQAPPSVPK